MGKNDSYLNGNREPDQGKRSAEAAMVLPDVPEAMPRRERIQVPLHERVAPAPDAGLRPEPHPNHQRLHRGGESMFLEHMKRSHRFSRIDATVVYNECIADRNHVHMNSTQWATLTEFVKNLGKSGKCKVEETPKGWFITYIDRDSETLFKERMKNKRVKADMVEEEKMEREIQKQIERAEQMTGSDKGGEEEGMSKSRMMEKNDEEGGAKIKLSLGQSKKNPEMNGNRGITLDCCLMRSNQIAGQGKARV